MKILDNGIIKDKYDVIVIGAGNGGLTAAAMLANRGVDVLVIEQHYIPGGCVTSLRRQDCACDIGAAILFGFSPEGFNPHYYIHNELEEPIDMVAHESTFCMEWGEGKRVIFHKDVDKFIEDLTETFPSKKEELKAYYDYMFKIHKAVTSAQVPYAMTELISWRHPRLGTALKQFFRHPIGMIKVLRLLNKPGIKIFNKYLKQDHELKKFFDICQGLFTCTRIDESPAVLSTMMFADMHKGGACYPVGSPQMLPNKLERATERLGGQIIQRQSVEEILFKPDKKTAYGVRLSDGTVIEADYIISNADAYSLYGKLIKHEYIDPEKMEAIQKLKPTTSTVLLYMGVDKEVIPEDAHNIEFYIEDKENFFNNCYAFIPSIDDPSICPPDMHSMTVLYPAHEVEWPRPDDPFYQTDDYEGLKEQIADKVLTRLEKWIPNLKKHIRFMEIATPTTVERFTRKYKGHVGGPAQIMGQHFFKRPHTRTEFKNIFMCGDSTFMGEGVVSTAASGVSAANVVLKEGKYGKWYNPKKFKKNVINYFPIGPQRIPVPSDEEALTEKTAQRLAMQCQLCEERHERGKCRNDCPAGIDVLNFIRRIEAGNYKGAARFIREMNPLGEICGAVCPAEELCEKECYKLEYDKDLKPTQIKRLQKWVCEKAGEEGWVTYVPEPNGYKVAVVGAGPGGLSCAYFLARLGYSVDIFEKEKEIGGLMSQVIPSFRLPQDSLNRDLTGISNHPRIKVEYNKELGKNVTVPELSKDYDAIFLAPGLGAGRSLKLPGIED
ncbi:MAG: FAD-dependent oxidoreductase, partial [Candidatus Hodarchaeota archaeon]